MKKEAVIGGLLGLLIGAFGVWLIVCGGPGGGRVGPKFRRIRLINASDTKVAKFEVWNTTASPVKVWQNTDVVNFDGNPDDHVEKEWNNTDGRPGVTKLEVRITLDLGGGTLRVLDPVPVDSGNSNSTFADVSVVLDNSLTAQGDFEVAVVAAHALDVADAHTNVVVEAQRTPK